VFDLVDPITGIQHERLVNYRKFMERFGYNPEWLERYFWDVIGSPPGEEIFINRWLPPQELVEAYLGVRGFKVHEVIREPNFDGRGTDNLVYVSQLLEGAAARQFQAPAQEKMREWEWYQVPMFTEKSSITGKSH
jgi:hypothetical protein